VTFAYGPRTVLAGVDLTVAPGMRVGIVGPNGAGKSTLLGILSGRVAPDAGSMTVAPPTAIVGELRQEPERRTGETVAAYLERRTGVAEANAAFEAATEALAAGDAGADDAYAEALERWLAIGAADFDARAEEVVTRLGLDDALLSSEMTALSGGQAARAGLAALLLSRFDALLLDEPTNDLDFDGLEQLEQFALNYDGAIVVVSHDRAFLDRIVTDVAELDEHSHSLTLFGGGWEAFQREKALARQHAEEAYGVYQDQKRTLQGRAQQQHEWADQGTSKAKKSGETDKFIKHRNTSQSEKLAGKAKRTEKELERLEVVDKPWEGWELQFEIANAPRSGAVTARLDSAVVTFDDYVLGPVTVEVGYGETVGIVGPNGAGKSTLLKAMFGKADLKEGVAWVGPGVIVGEISQARDRFDGDATLQDAFMNATGWIMSDTRTLLAKFGLGAEHVGRTTSSLSPGERTRAALALLQAIGVNTLVLDEPTNHLDLPAIEQLEQAVAAFPGTVLLVTHDRRLLDAIPFTRILRVDNGTVTDTTP